MDVRNDERAALSDPFDVKVGLFIWNAVLAQVLQGGGRRAGREKMGRVAVVFIEHATPNFVARQAFGLVKGFMYFLEIDEDAEDRMDVN